MTKLLGINTSFRDALYKRGLSYDHLGEYKKAIDNFSTILALNGQDAAAQRGQGDAWFALGDFHQAAGSYESCLKSAGATKQAFPAEDLADIYNKKGLSYFETSDNEKAVNDFKTALHSNRNLAVAYFNLGNAYYQTAHFSDATENITKALSLESKPPYRWPYILGKAYEGSKDLKNALNAYTSAVSLDAGVLHYPTRSISWDRRQYNQGPVPRSPTVYNRLQPCTRTPPRLPRRTREYLPPIRESSIRPTLPLTSFIQRITRTGSLPTG